MILRVPRVPRVIIRFGVPPERIPLHLKICNLPTLNEHLLDLQVGPKRIAVTITKSASLAGFFKIIHEYILTIVNYLL